MEITHIQIALFYIKERSEKFQFFVRKRMNLVPVPGRYGLAQIFRRPLGAAHTNEDEWLRKKRHLTIHFRADRLGVNITFQEIYFSARDINICLFGMIEVVVAFGHPLRYCGSQPRTSVFSAQPAVDIRLYLEPYTAFYFNLNFSVVDEKTMQSNPPNPSLLNLKKPFQWVHLTWSIMNKWKTFKKATKRNMIKAPKHWKDASILRLWSVSYLLPDILEEAFLLSSVKFAWISLKVVLTAGFGLVAHDGPGTFSRILYSNVCFTKQCNCTVNSSTFQVFLIHFSKAQVSHLVDINFVSYTQSLKKWKVAKLYQGQPRHFVVPSEALCNIETICLVLLKTVKEQHLNISIKDLKYKGMSNINCSFSGIGFYNYPSFAKTSVVCPQPNYIGNQKESVKEYVDIHRYRNIYSAQSSLIVVFYSFKEYGNLVMNLQAESTKCEVVIINTCNGSKLTDPSLESIYVLGESKYKLDLEPGGCKVLQTIYSLSDYDSQVEKCLLNIEERIRNQAKGSQLKFTVLGFIRGMNQAMWKTVVFPFNIASPDCGLYHIVFLWQTHMQGFMLGPCNLQIGVP